MFRVTFMTDERRLGFALKALTGHAIGAPDVQPLTNARIGENGQVVRAEAPEPKEFFREFPKEFQKADIVKALIAIGRSRHSAQAFINDALKAKAIKRGKRGSYTKL